MLDVHHAAVDVCHDLAAAVDDPHHHAAADDVCHDVLTVRHDVLATLQQQTFTQEALDGMGDEVETMEEEGKKMKVIAEVIKSNLFMSDLITLYCTCCARCRVVYIIPERQ